MPDLVRELGLIATATAHGAQSPQRTDLGPLAGKELVLLPDHDAPGEAYVSKLLGLFSKLDPKPRVRVLRLDLQNEGDDIEQWLAARPGVDKVELQKELERLADDCPPEGLAVSVTLNGKPHEANGHAVEPSLVASLPVELIIPGAPDLPNEAPDDFHALARLYLESQCLHRDRVTLGFWQGQFVRWDAGAYRHVPESEVNALINSVIKAEFDRLNRLEVAEWEKRATPGGRGKSPLKPTVRRVSKTLTGNVSAALASYCLIPERIQQPCWLGDPVRFPAEEVLPTRNALVHLPSFVAGRDAIHPPTPRFFCPYVLDFDFDPVDRFPEKWFAFLRSLWPNDSESICTLQMWMGYLLTPDTSRQKILMLVGPKRSGKGTIARIIRALIGASNTANPTLSSLGTNFGLAPLIGKPAAFITDARLSGRTDIAQVVERLLSISGEDAQTIDRKHLPAATVKLPTRFTIISNELLRASDSSGALAGRMIILKLVESFFGRENLDLEKELLQELPAILRWAIEGWRRLQEQGQFVQPASARQLAEEMEDLASPVGMFVKERCELDDLFSVGVKELFADWKAWCQTMNRESVGEETWFGRNLRAVVPRIVTKPRRQGEGFGRDFHGIRLKKVF